ncbi:MAG: MarR family transcriptional regulator [Enterocloster asparagiformis]|nr:MarR family transcriptional regulator [Enterocloster asparagiformis]
MTDEERFSLFCELVDSFDVGCKYVNDYNSLLHDYNGVVLYQAESQFIHKIGQEPGITITELAVYFDKTRSACSQLMRRMKDKGWLSQTRNRDNNREYNLFLTEEGQKIYNYHLKFEEACYRRSARMLDEFSEAEMETYIRIQKKLNESFKLDVEESKRLQVNSSK